MKDFLRQRVFGPHYRWWALGIVGLAVFMVTTDAGLLNISLPIIVRYFQADMTLAGWIVLTYALVTGALYLPFGRLADLIGRKKVLARGFLLYSLSSALAGLSQSPSQLIFFRALQAVGSALMMSTTFALVTSLFPPEERGRAMGISGGTVTAIGFTLGPSLGGFLAHTLGWRYIFYVTSLLGVLGAVAVRLILPEEEKGSSEVGRREPFDLVGAAAFTLGLTAFLLALTAGQREGWDARLIRGAFLLALSSLGFFLWWESRSPYPLLDLRLFHNRLFAAGNVARLVSFVATSMNSLIMPFFLQWGLALDPLTAGLYMTSSVLALAVLSPLSGWLSEKMGARLLSSLGLTIMGIAFWMLSLLRPGVSPLDVVLRLALVGVGLGLFQTPNNNSLMSSIPPDRLGVGSSFLSIVRSVGQSVGAALASTLVGASLRTVAGNGQLPDFRTGAASSGDAVLLSAFLQGYQHTYRTAAILSILGVLASLLRGPKKAP